VAAFAALSGCWSSPKRAELPPPLPPQKSVEPRQLHVTLVGGDRLNAGATGVARPVQTCLYMVRSQDWLPGAVADDSSCAARDRDSAIVATSRHVIAPHQLRQLMLEVPPSGEFWLVADADYAQRPASYAPLRLRIDGSGMVHAALWLDRDGIYNALRSGPVPVADREPAARRSGASAPGAITSIDDARRAIAAAAAKPVIAVPSINAR
jgi:type VI secretion system protein VasD